MSNANPFVPKGRQPKFRVVITIHDLLNIPLNSGFVYVRWHVKDSGHSESKGRTHNAVVKDYRSVWNVDVDSKVRMMVDKNGNLQESLVVVQVFQEIMGAKASLGCVQINLAEYTGVETETRRFLLQRSKVNCTLKVTTAMKQLSGDSDFKAPVLQKAQVFGGISGLMADPKKTGDKSAGLLFRPGSSGSHVDVMCHDMYRRTVAARSDLPAGELEPAEVVEAIFAGGDAWATRDTKSARHRRRSSLAAEIGHDTAPEDDEQHDRATAAQLIRAEQWEREEREMQGGTSWIL